MKPIRVPPCPVVAAMGSFFSLREANEWEQVTKNMFEASIWSHATFSPLTRESRVLYDRPRVGQKPKAHFQFPQGLKQGGDVITISEASEVSLLVCFDEKFGRLYSAILLTAPESAPHVYSRAVEEVVLRAPNMNDGIMSPTATTTFNHSSSPFRKTLRSTPGSCSSPNLLKKSSLSSIGRRMVESPSSKSTGKSWSPEFTNMDDIVELVEMLDSETLVPPFPDAFHQTPFEDPKTVGALAGLQLAILASAPPNEYPGMKDAIREAGAISPLVNFLRSGRQDKVQVAVLALGYLADDNATNARIMHELKTMPNFLKLMTSAESAGMRGAAAASLRNIAAAFEGSGVSEWLAPSRLCLNTATGEHHVSPAVHVGDPNQRSDAGYEVVLSWLQAIGLRDKAREFQKGRQALSNPNMLHLQKMLHEPPKTETECRYLVLYNVKEGTLIYQGNDHDSCVQVVRDIAVMLGITTHPPGRTSLVSGTTIGGPDRVHRSMVNHKESFDSENSRTGDMIRKAVEDQVKCVEMPVGKVKRGTACYTISSVIIADLSRRFAVHCEADEQSECTNCVMFCMRVLSELRLTARGYDVRRLCEERADLGAKAGEAVSIAWERLWGRTGANMHTGLCQHDQQTTSAAANRWREALGSTQEDPHRLLHAWRKLPRPLVVKAPLVAT